MCIVHRKKKMHAAKTKNWERGFHINSTSLVDIELTPLRLKKAYDLQFPGPSVRGCLQSLHPQDLAVARGDTGFERWASVSLSFRNWFKMVSLLSFNFTFFYTWSVRLPMFTLMSHFYFLIYMSLMIFTFTFCWNISVTFPFYQTWTLPFFHLLPLADKNPRLVQLSQLATDGSWSRQAAFWARPARSLCQGKNHIRPARSLCQGKNIKNQGKNHIRPARRICQGKIISDQYAVCAKLKTQWDPPRWKCGQFMPKWNPNVKEPEMWV